jgi:hypothetical protein
MPLDAPHLDFPNKPKLEGASPQAIHPSGQLRSLFLPQYSTYVFAFLCIRKGIGFWGPHDKCQVADIEVCQLLNRTQVVI